MSSAKTRSRLAATARGAVLVLVLLLAPRPAPAQTPPLGGLDGYITRAMRAWNVPGLAIAVVEGEKVVLARGYGVREIGRPAPVDDRTIFAIGSATKAFTVTAIGMLVDEGKIDLDAPAIRYLPGFQLYDAYATGDVTVRDLLSHRTGVAGGDLLWASGGFDRDEIVRRLRFLQPTWRLRSRFDYSNVMFIAAGQLLAAVAGRSWDQVVRERILQPLGMTSTTSSVRDLPADGDVATPHDPTAAGARPVPWRNMDNTVAGGGINSSVRDLSQWLRFQLRRGAGDRGRLLSEAFIQEMRTPQTVIRREGAWADMTPEAHFMAYGLGWIISDYRGRQLLQHGGGIDGMSAMVGLLPEKDVGVAVLSNLNGNQLPAALMYRVFDAYLGVPPTDWSAHALELGRRAQAASAAASAVAEPEPPEAAGPTLELARYAGTYRNDAWGDAVVTFENGKLLLRYGTQFVGELEHLRNDRFRARWRNPARGTDQVNFTIDVQRQPAQLDIYLWLVASFHRVSAESR